MNSLQQSGSPIIALTIGDPAGIGPEIVLKALSDPAIFNVCRPVVIGDYEVLRQAALFSRISLQLNPIQNVSAGKFIPGVLDLIDLNNVNSLDLQLGKVQAMCGKAVYDYIAAATNLALHKEIDAIATAPINKESLKAGGVNFIGHTEIFGALCNVADPLTMFETCGIRTFFLSRHVALRQACDLVTKERVLDYIIRSVEALQKLRVSTGSFAVAGLNPHCGEHGLFGDEELTAIIPAIAAAQQLGYDVIGPISADSIFYLAKQKKYSGILSLYHDQGHIGMKTLDFEKTIAITCGLPFIRTSVDHGTSFDKAGKGIASPVSMCEAIFAAARYSNSV